MIPLALPEVYKLIEPGPVVLLATRARSGRANVMTMSWHMMTEFAPPSVACVVSSANHSFKALRSTGECVIAIPSVAMAETVVAVGNVRAGAVTSSRRSASLLPRRALSGHLSCLSVWLTSNAA